MSIQKNSSASLLWLYSPLLGPDRFLSFLIPYTDGRAPWTEDYPVARPLPTRADTDMHALSGIQTHDPAFETTKTVHASDGEATVIGCIPKTTHQNWRYTVLNIQDALLYTSSWPSG
jgi:hypothetical protein